MEILPLPARSKTAIADIAGYFNSSEQSICNGIILVINRLQKQMETLENTAAEETKRTSALCLSGAALLVILLI